MYYCILKTRIQNKYIYLNRKNIVKNILDGCVFELKTNSIFFSFTITVCSGVKITNLKVPTTYTIEESPNADGLILDCEYELGTEETGFVLKWLFNDHSIYQWIPSHKPYALVRQFLPIFNFLFRILKCFLSLVVYERTSGHILFGVKG